MVYIIHNPPRVDGFAKATQVPLNIVSLTAQDLNNAFMQISPYGNAPILISINPQKHMTWIQYFDRHRKRSQDLIQNISRSYGFWMLAIYLVNCSRLTQSC